MLFLWQWSLWKEYQCILYEYIYTVSIEIREFTHTNIYIYIYIHACEALRHELAHFILGDREDICIYIYMCVRHWGMWLCDKSGGKSKQNIDYFIKFLTRARGIKVMFYKVLDACSIILYCQNICMYFYDWVWNWKKCTLQQFETAKWLRNHEISDGNHSVDSDISWLYLECIQTILHTCHIMPPVNLFAYF